MMLRGDEFRIMVAETFPPSVLDTMPIPTLDDYTPALKAFEPSARNGQTIKEWARLAAASGLAVRLGRESFICDSGSFLNRRF